ncbi:DEAD/DEAH box helicase [Sulfurimonas sp.]|uniref:DEAD/DEAH box helicase n=1 Tax=Sulfurimonas sp. TaxID=2022749 RepID=UPI002B46D524|nr:DEAD/DEAH box helicase [Sulfurimonas sp.]
MLEETTKKHSIKKYYDNVNVGKRTKQVVYLSEQQDKDAMFELYLKSNEKKQSVVVVKSKRRADELCVYLNSKDIDATVIHGNHRKEQLEKGAQEFNAGSINIFITTDKILQSLELNHIETIINYDLPSEHEDYFSRLLLVDEVGESISFVSPEEEGYLATIEIRLKNEISQEILEGFVPTTEDKIIHKIKEKKKKPRHRKNK